MPVETSTLEVIQRTVDAIEGAYEFLLAYAAQGVATDVGSVNSDQLREYLRRMDVGLGDVAAQYRAAVGAGPVCAAFLDLLEDDAAAARSVVRVVAAQQGISSQLVDNLNASVHVRALLTDLFLIDEVVKGLK